MPGSDKNRYKRLLHYQDVQECVDKLYGELGRITLKELELYTLEGVFKELDQHLVLEDTHLRAALALSAEDNELMSKAKKQHKKKVVPRQEEINYHCTQAEYYRARVNDNKRFMEFARQQRA